MEYSAGALSRDATARPDRGCCESPCDACTRPNAPDTLHARLGWVVCKLLIHMGSELGIDIVLTEDYVEKVERLLEQTGAPRPGYLHDGPDNVEGNSEQPTLSAHHPSTDTPAARRPIRLSLHWEEDPETGAYDLIRD